MHWLCGWMIKEMVSEAISRGNSEITHQLCGWTINEMVSETISEGFKITYWLWVDDQRNG